MKLNYYYLQEFDGDAIMILIKYKKKKLKILQDR